MEQEVIVSQEVPLRGSLDQSLVTLCSAFLSPIRT